MPGDEGRRAESPRRVRAATPAGPAADEFDRCLSGTPRWEVDSAANARLRACLASLAAEAELRATRSPCRRRQAVLKKAAFACDRLEDINISYTLYRDLVIVGNDGTVIANSNKATRPRVLGLNVADESWFQHALATKDGTQYHAQDLTASRIEESSQSLIYSAGVRRTATTTGG